MDRIHVIIIPNEEKMNVSTFYKTSTIANHEDLMKDFYKMHNLELPEYGNFYDDLIDKGFIVILTFDKRIVVFVPNIISKCKWKC